MGYGILIGIITTVFYYTILSPIIDLKLEHYRYKITTKCTEEKLDADEMTVNFVRKYPEYNKQEDEESTCNAIGFHMDNEEESYEYEDEDDE